MSDEEVARYYSQRAHVDRRDQRIAELAFFVGMAHGEQKGREWAARVCLGHPSGEDGKPHWLATCLADLIRRGPVADEKGAG